jgi:hypothetical protein
MPSDYIINMVHVNEVRFKLKGTEQLLFYADNVNILGGSIYGIYYKGKTEKL